MGGDCTRFQAAQRLICANLPLAPRAGKRVFRLPDILRAPLFTHLMQSSIFRPFQPFSGCQPSQGNPRAAKHRHSGKTLSAIHPNHLPKRAGFRAQIAAARPIRLPALRPRRIRGWRTRWRGVLLVIRRARPRLLPRRMSRIRSRHVWLGGIFGKLVFAVGGRWLADWRRARPQFVWLGSRAC